MHSKKHNRELAKQIHTFRVAASVTEDAIHDFLSSIDSPLSLSCWLLYVNKEHLQLSEKEVNPSNYVSFEEFRDDYTAINFLAKANFLELEVSKRDNAIAKFRRYEEQCKSTNIRFNHPTSDPLAFGQNAWLLNATIRKIQMILGTYSAEEFVGNANWGPGVSTLLKGAHVSSTNKFHSECGITQDLYDFVMPWFSEAYPLWADHLESEFGPDLFCIQRGNEVITVPKNSKTDRVIAVEPGINLWFQKAIGTMIRRRLARFGVDLNSQVRNQSLAKESSLDNSLATIDFSSASDSISRDLVRELLPTRWFQLLDITRSKVGVLDDQVLTWNKFSSMGNGFTFELESLIFFAAAWASCEFHGVTIDKVSVFGDDVILPNQIVSETFSLFSAYLGFTVSKEKSFFSGYFRESCGSHFYNGKCCKPLFLKERLQNAQAVYRLANGVRRLAHRRNSYYGCDQRFHGTFRRLQLRLPKSFRFGIPEGVGDGGFIGNFDESVPVVAGDGIEGYYFPCLLEVGVSQHFEGVGLLLARLWAIPSDSNIFRKQLSRAYSNNYTLRGRTKTKVSNVLVPRWYNLGEWM